MATGWTGKLFRGSVNSVEKFLVQADGQTYYTPKNVASTVFETAGRFADGSAG